MNKECFVIMPFNQNFTEVFNKVIKPAINEAGYFCIRSDEDSGSPNITKAIIKHIDNSEAIIADLSEVNSNVFYELGIAHSFGNKTIMITQNISQIPFDIQEYKIIQYNYDFSGGVELRSNLIERLRNIDEWKKNSSNPVIDSGIKKSLPTKHSGIFANNGEAPVVVSTYPHPEEVVKYDLVSELKITFSKPMQNGCSICYISPQSFPKLIGKPYFSKDKRNLIHKIELEPHRKYVMWFNLPDYIGFADTEGNIAIPYMLTFRTE
jgi:hypothetical protein